MKSTRIAGLHYWGEFQADRRIDFNGWFWERSGGNVLIDPMPLDEAGVAFLRERGGVQWILVNNADHLRAAALLGRDLDAELIAPAAERERLGEAAMSVRHWFETAADLPGGLADEVEVVPLAGGKSPMEPAFHLKPLSALYFGDLVRSHETGALRLLPDPKISDRAAVVASLQPLKGATPDAILLGDGDPILSGAAGALESLLGSL